MKKTQQIISIPDNPLELPKKYLLPQGTRATDLSNINAKDEEVLMELALNGRRTRYWFLTHDMLNAVRRLKTRGLVCAVRKGSNYSYDLTQVGYWFANKIMPGLKSM